MIITIHQPNFIPWYPFFQKMAQADVFILLGHCQFEKNGYQNRFFFNEMWNTLSVSKGKIPINEKKYLNPIFDWNKIKKKLFKYRNILEEFDPYIENNLYKTNKNIIKHISNKLNINTKIVEDFNTELRSTERLVMLCKHYNATTYLAGQGSKEYLNLELFKKENIEVIFQQDMNTIHTLEVL